jgi:hypothetical protein
MSASSSIPKIAIVVAQRHPRVVYALETIFSEFLGMDCGIVLADEVDKARSDGFAVFSYLPIGRLNLPAFPCNGLLYEDHIRPADESIVWGVPNSDFLLEEDLFAKIFFELSQYSLLQPGADIQLDAHGRYADAKGELIVHQWLRTISQAIQPLLSTPIQPREFDFELTIDVDQPWKYLHKPWWMRWGGLVKDIFKQGDSKERWNVLTGKQSDPFSVLELVKEICPAAKTKVFFLNGGAHPNDSRYAFGMEAYQILIREWKSAGFEIGIHPSYTSSEDAEKMRSEKEALEKLIGPVTISRQHYLRYKTPDTLRQLINLGIQRDYTLCRSTGPGAPTGVVLPYRWFDLERNVVTHLQLIPAMVMDRSLLQYQGLNPTEAGAAIAKAIAQTKAVGGKFVIILHNETFSESGEWKGWLSVIRKAVELLQQ